MQVEFPWMHQRNTGKSLSLPEGWAELLKAAWIPTVSQSDWPESRMYLIPAVADSSAVLIPSNLYHAFSLQDLTWQQGTKKSHCSLAPPLWMELFVQKSLHSGFNLQFSIIGGNVQLYPNLPRCQTWEGSRQFSAGRWVFWVVSHCFCDFLRLLSLWRKEEKMFIDLGWWSAWF